LAGNDVVLPGGRMVFHPGLVKNVQFVKTSFILNLGEFQIELGEENG